MKEVAGNSKWKLSSIDDMDGITSLKNKNIFKKAKANDNKRKNNKKGNKKRKK